MQSLWKVKKEVYLWNYLISRQLSAIAYDKYGVRVHKSADSESWVDAIEAASHVRCKPVYSEHFLHEEDQQIASAAETQRIAEHVCHVVELEPQGLELADCVRTVIHARLHTLQGA